LQYPQPSFPVQMFSLHSSANIPMQERDPALPRALPCPSLRFPPHPARPPSATAFERVDVRAECDAPLPCLVYWLLSF
jgi:hypothetical protein